MAEIPFREELKKQYRFIETDESNDYKLADFIIDSLLTSIKNKYPEIPVIIITGYSDMRTAVKVMKMGAYDYITKPLLPDEVIHTIQQAIDHNESGVTNPASKSRTGTITEKPAADTGGVTYSGKYVFGDTEAFHKILKQVALVAPTS